MINLDSIIEKILVQIIVMTLSAIPTIILPNIKKRRISEFEFDVLKTAIFFSLISILNLILNMSFWKNQDLNVLFTLLSLLFGGISYYIYQNRCPECKKFIGAKKQIDEKIIDEFEKKIPYQPLRVYKYSNGEIKHKEPFGKKKIRIEKWKTEQKFYECNHCKHKWDSGYIKTPIFIEKESHSVIKTREKDPNELEF